MCHGITLNNKTNRVHKPALRIIYNDHRSNFKSLLVKDHFFNIQEKNLQYLAAEAFKVKRDLVLNNEGDFSTHRDPKIQKLVFLLRSPVTVKR